MCGIAGSFAYAEAAPPVDRAELERVSEAMARRGPDGKGFWSTPDGRVAFAHRRLAIIDLKETGNQPMSTADGRLTIVFNGEIYNYRELRRELEAKGFAFRTQSDTEVLLHLYHDRGAAMVGALRGMFTFAIWDERQQSLFLARDPFGIKPLYVADDGKTLRFASQVKALALSAAGQGREEPAGYVGFLLWGFVPEPYTLHRGIRSLAAGSHLTLFKGGRRSQVEYFSIRREMLELAGEDGTARAEDTYAQIHELLKGSVEHHLVSDVPVGLFLSSGIDSCLIANFAAASLGSRLHTLTLGFSEFKQTLHDETGLASQVAADLGVEHSTRWTSREEVLPHLEQFFADMDQPSMDGLNTWLVSKAARDAGIKVALSGLGGDEMFAGYPSFRQVPMTARMMRPFARMPWVAVQARRMLHPLVSAVTSSKFASLFEYGSSVGGAYLLRRALYMPWELERIFDDEFVRNGLDELDTMPRLAGTVEGISNSRLIVSALELEWYLRSQLLRDADWAGMGHSLEIRVPFVDVPVFRTVVGMVLQDRAPTKQDVVRCVNGSLPAILATRRKTGFSVPVRDWFVENDPVGAKERGLRTWARNVLARWNLPSCASRRNFLTSQTSNFQTPSR
jgi:asparagine synthase (glutamine-hydrolysing)